MKQVSIRSLHIGAGAGLTSEEGLVLQLADNERIVNIDHDGNNVWVYIERPAMNVSRQEERLACEAEAEHLEAERREQAHLYESVVGRGGSL